MSNNLQQRKDKKGSEVWKHFDKNVEDSVLNAICQHCGKRLAADSKLHGTSQLWRHLRIHGIERLPQDGNKYTIAVGQEMILGCPKKIKASVGFSSWNRRHAILTWEQWKENVVVEHSCTNKEKQHKKSRLILAIAVDIVKCIGDKMKNFEEKQRKLKLIAPIVAEFTVELCCAEAIVKEEVFSLKDCIYNYEFLEKPHLCETAFFLGEQQIEKLMAKRVKGFPVLVSIFNSFRQSSVLGIEEECSSPMINGPGNSYSARLKKIMMYQQILLIEATVLDVLKRLVEFGARKEPSIPMAMTNGPETSYGSTSIARCWSPVHWSEVGLTLSPLRFQSISNSSHCFPMDLSPKNSRGFFMCPNFNISDDQEGCNSDDSAAAMTGYTGNQNWALVPAQTRWGPCLSDEELD